MPYRQYDRKLQLRVAYLKAKGLQQTKIAEELQISTSQVAKILEVAKVNGFIEPNPRFNKESCSREELAELRLLDRLENLLSNLREIAKGNNIDPSFCVNRVHVVPGHSTGTAPDSIRLRLASFSAFSAPELMRRIAASEFCGVTWGYTVASVVEALDRQDSSLLTGNHGRTFIATCGEPYSMEPSSSSSSRIALRLNAMQKGNKKTVYTLTGVPAFIPPEFNREAILPFIHKHTAFGKIFGSSELMRRRAIISKLDTVITSVGAIANPASTFHDELEKKSGLSANELKELTYGDIGGASLERVGLDEESHLQFEQISKMWIGVTHKDLKSVVERAANTKTKRSGVIVLTIGKNKARIVYEAVRRGLVSELFIDQELAFALLDLCKNPPKD